MCVCGSVAETEYRAKDPECEYYEITLVTSGLKWTGALSCSAGALPFPHRPASLPTASSADRLGCWLPFCETAAGWIACCRLDRLLPARLSAGRIACCRLDCLPAGSPATGWIACCRLDCLLAGSSAGLLICGRSVFAAELQSSLKISGRFIVR